MAVAAALRGAAAAAATAVLVAASLVGPAAGAAASSVGPGGASPGNTGGLFKTVSGSQLIDRATALADKAAEIAWVAEAQAAKVVKGNVKYLPLAKAEIAVAKTAEKAAAKQEKKATALLKEARKEARAAAMQAAAGFLAEVKRAGASGAAEEGAARRSMADQAEVSAARAASSAAMPYHAMLLRGQKVVEDYTKQAQAMAAAGSNLRAEGMTLASHAEQYQMVGQTAKAGQMMVTAHSLLNQGNMMTKQAENLSAEAKEVQEALPLYQQAEEAAFQSAAQTANPPGLPTSPPIY